MDFLELAKGRYSVRSFSDKKVEAEKIAKILFAANVAPTACNNQPQKIYILQSEEALSKLSSVCKYTFGAKTIFLLCYDENLAWQNPLTKGYNSGETDVSIVCTHMMLEAHNLGLGSCWVGYFEHSKISEIFSLPDNIKPVALLPIGYIPDSSRPSHLHETYRKQDEMVEIL